MNSIKIFIKNLEIKNYILYIFILLILSCFTLTYILLIPDSELKIVGEFFLEINHNLLAVKGSKLSEIKNIYY